MHYTSYSLTLPLMPTNQYRFMHVLVPVQYVVLSGLQSLLFVSNELPLLWLKWMHNRSRLQSTLGLQVV